MSLATATAFQFSSTIQMRAFTALGCLGTTDVDDDFLYQMLVAFNSAMARMEEGDTLPVVSMLRSINKIIPAVRGRSRFLPHLFWLAVAMLQSSHMGFYEEAAKLLFTTLSQMNEQDMFESDLMSNVLVDARADLGDALDQLDRSVRLSFDTNFSLALAPIIFKAARQNGLQLHTEKILRALLNVSANASRRYFANGNEPTGSIQPESLGYFLALLPFCTTPPALRKLLQDCLVDDIWLGHKGSGAWDDVNWVPRVPFAMLGINDADTAMFVSSFLGGMVSSAHSDSETEMIFGLLSDLANIYPEVLALVYVFSFPFSSARYLIYLLCCRYCVCADKIKSSFMNSTNSTLIRYASEVLRVSSRNYLEPSIPKVIVPKGSVTTFSTTGTDESSDSGKGKLTAALERHGMGGLAEKETYAFSKDHGKAVMKWIPQHLFALILL
jgi:hypothetical protein